MQSIARLQCQGKQPPQRGQAMATKQISNKKIIVSVAIAIIGISVIWYNMSDVSSVTITQKSAQVMIAKKLPITKEIKVAKFDMKFVVDQIDVGFENNNILSVVAHATVDTSVGSASVLVRTTGTPVYQSMAFYYQPQTFEFSEFTLSDKALANTKTAGQIASNATKKFDKYLKNSGLLDGTDISVAQTAEVMTAKIREYAKPALETIIIEYLTDHPIKKLDGVKGFVVSLAIDEIQVANNTLTIEFSLLAFTLNMVILILVFIALISILWFLPLGLVTFD